MLTNRKANNNEGFRVFVNKCFLRWILLLDKKGFYLSFLGPLFLIVIFFIFWWTHWVIFPLWTCSFFFLTKKTYSNWSKVNLFYYEYVLKNECKRFCLAMFSYWWLYLFELIKFIFLWLNWKNILFLVFYNLWTKLH